MDTELVIVTKLYVFVNCLRAGMVLVFYSSYVDLFLVVGPAGLRYMQSWYTRSLEKVHMHVGVHTM